MVLQRALRANGTPRIAPQSALWVMTGGAMGIGKAGDCQAGEVHGRIGEAVEIASDVCGGAKAVAGGAKRGDGETTGGAGLARGACAREMCKQRWPHAIAMEKARSR